MKARIIIPTASKYPPCIFCGAPANSREHAWPQWLIKRLKKQIGQKVIIDGEFDHKRIRPKTSLFVDHIVCEKKCNNGWMRRLENETIPILSPMMLGEAGTLSSTAQLTLATWGTLRAIICNGFRPPLFYDSRETSHLLTNGTPPHSTFGAWVGFCSIPLAFTDGKRLTRRSSGGSIIDEGYVQTVVFGHAMLQVLTIRKTHNQPVALVEVDVVRGPWDLAIDRIWPVQLHPAVHWPPKVGLDFRAGDLHGLANRFNTSSR